MVSGDGYLLPSNIRQIVARDKLHLYANLAWLIFFDFRYSDNVILFFYIMVDTVSIGMQNLLPKDTITHE